MPTNNPSRRTMALHPHCTVPKTSTSKIQGCSSTLSVQRPLQTHVNWYAWSHSLTPQYCLQLHPTPLQEWTESQLHTVFLLCSLQSILDRNWEYQYSLMNAMPMPMYQNIRHYTETIPFIAQIIINHKGHPRNIITNRFSQAFISLLTTANIILPTSNLGKETQLHLPTDPTACPFIGPSNVFSMIGYDITITNITTPLPTNQDPPSLWPRQLPTVKLLVEKLWSLF